jgi:hypothetical protein
MQMMAVQVLIEMTLMVLMKVQMDLLSVQV